MEVGSSFWRRFTLMMAGVLGMGVFISLLLEVGYGTDTCSFMNSSIATSLTVGLGPVMVCLNIALFIPQLLWGRRMIGVGTLASMTLIGFTSDLCTLLWDSTLPSWLFTSQPWRSFVFVVALPLFLLCAAVYMNADLGLAPFDAIPTMVSRKAKLPFYAVRMAWDALAIIVGVAAGGKLTAGTIILALTVGPSVSWIGRKMVPLLSQVS